MMRVQPKEKKKPPSMKLPHCYGLQKQISTARTDCPPGQAKVLTGLLRLLAGGSGRLQGSGRRFPLIHSVRKARMRGSLGSLATLIVPLWRERHISHDKVPKVP